MNALIGLAGEPDGSLLLILRGQNSMKGERGRCLVFAVKRKRVGDSVGDRLFGKGKGSRVTPNFFKYGESVQGHVVGDVRNGLLLCRYRRRFALFSVGSSQP